MSPLVPGSRDQKQLKRKRKTKQKLCINKKKPKINLFEKKKVQKFICYFICLYVISGRDVI